MLTLASFSSAGELTTFVNDEGVLQADIVWIIQRSGTWFLFYWV